MPDENHVSAKALLAEFAEVIERWPLYRKLRYQASHPEMQSNPHGGKVRFVPLPETITLFCDNKKCNKQLLWELCGGEYYKRICFGKELIHERKYLCRNCQQNVVYYFHFCKETTDGGDFAKVGQYPPLAEIVPANLKNQLDKEDLRLYERALRLRNHDLGIGSLAYLRRVVENRTNDMLDVLAEVAKETGSAPEELKNIDEVKAGKRFDDKITYGAKLMPQHLRPGGLNPVDLLHDLASDGLHSKSEDECVEIFDRCRHVFEYVFSELRVGLDEAKKFHERLKELSRHRQ
jgi:hypothetical protein